MSIIPRSSEERNELPPPFSSVVHQRRNSASYSKELLAEAWRILKKQREQRAILLNRQQQNVR